MQSVEIVSKATGSHTHAVEPIVVAAVFKVAVINEVVVEIVVAIVIVTIAFSAFGLLLSIVAFLHCLLVLFAIRRGLALLLLLGLHLVASVLLYWSQSVVVFDSCDHCLD